MGDSERIIILEDMSKGGICVELGVWRGEFAQHILSILNPQKLYLVDPWQSQSDEQYNRAWYSCSQDEINEIHGEVLKRFEKEIETGQVEVCPITSLKASSLFEDEYFDFIYVDGNHLYDFVKNDLKLYFPKLKSGGIIMGDDYNIEGWWDNGVKRAVDEFDHSDLADKTVVKDQFFLKKAE